MDSFLFAVIFLVNFCIVWTKEGERSSLTKATAPVHYPKPTVHLRRHDSKKITTTHAPADPLSKNHSKDHLNLHSHEIRRSDDLTQWGWDKWCQMQPKVGSCGELQRYFYYQVQTDSCREFAYTGCNGNENRFLAKHDCDQFCKGFGLVLENTVLTQSETCMLQPNPGNCLAYMTRFYYDVNHGRCREFIYGGCGGNGNKFMSYESCMRMCGNLFPTTKKQIKISSK